jgi:hypothetical protein
MSKEEKKMRNMRMRNKEEECEREVQAESEKGEHEKENARATISCSSCSPYSSSRGTCRTPMWPLLLTYHVGDIDQGSGVKESRDCALYQPREGEVEDVVERVALTMDEGDDEVDKL